MIRVEYEEHRRQLHQDKLGVRERSASAANSEISETSSAKSRMDLRKAAINILKHSAKYYLKIKS